MVIGDAFSRDKSSRKYGFTRFQAARVQTKWLRHLKKLRKEAREGREAKAGQDAGEGQEAALTLKNVIKELHPFIDQEMD